MSGNKKMKALVFTGYGTIEHNLEWINAPLHRSIMFYLAGSKIRSISKKTHIRYFRFLTESNGTQLSAISDLADSGVIKPVIDRIFPFNKLEQALAYAEKGHLKGKVIIEGPS